METKHIFSQVGWGKGPPKLRGLACAYHPVALGSNPNHNVYA